MEEKLSKDIGSRIRLYRKNRRMSMETLAAMVHKSKASISKYELGQTTLDITTLVELAQALGVAPAQLLDGSVRTVQPFQAGGGHHTEAYYLYYLTKKQPTLSRLVFDYEDEDKDDTSCAATLYHTVKSFENYTDCKSIYRGRMYNTHVILSVMLQSIRIPSSHVLMCFTRNLNNEKVSLGMLSGVGTGRVRPMAMRVLMTAEPIRNEAELIERLSAGPETIKLLKKEEKFFAIDENISQASRHTPGK